VLLGAIEVDFRRPHCEFPTQAAIVKNWYSCEELVPDGYPDWRVSVKTYKKPLNKQQKTFGKHQEGVRKAMERFFGVLFRRYRILRQPFALWFQEDMAVIMEACFIMHNMTVRERKTTYTGTRVARVAADAAEAEDAGMKTYHKIAAPEEPIALVEWLQQGAGQVENRERHHDLQVALTENMYACAGDNKAEESSGDDFVEGTEALVGGASTESEIETEAE